MKMAGKVTPLIFITIQLGNVIMAEEINFKCGIDLENIKYKFQCGTVECDGIRQFCTEDQICQYCSADLCKVQNSPAQCQLQCRFYQQKEEVENTTWDGPKSQDAEGRDECVGIGRKTLHIIIGCVVCVVVLLLIIAVVCYKMPDKKKVIIYYVKNQFYKCCRCEYPPDNRYKTTCTDDKEEVTSVRVVPSGN